MVASVVDYAASAIATGSAALTVPVATVNATDAVVVVASVPDSTTTVYPVSVSGLGATWTRVVGPVTNDSSGTTTYAQARPGRNEVWVGTGATGPGNVTVTPGGYTFGLRADAHVVRGLRNPTRVAWDRSNTATPAPTLSQAAQAGQFVLLAAASYTNDGTMTVGSLSPATDWTDHGITATTSYRHDTLCRIPTETSPVAHGATVTTTNTLTNASTVVVLGDPDVASSTDVAHRASTATVFNGTDGSTTTVTVPAAAQAGDVLLLSATSRQALGTPSGWTQIHSGTASFGFFYVWTRTCQAGDPGSLAVALSSGTSGRVTAAISAYSGAVAPTAANVTAGTSGTANAPTLPGVTVVKAGSAYVGFGFVYYGSDGRNAVAAPLTGRVGDGASLMLLSVGDLLGLPVGAVAAKTTTTTGSSSAFGSQGVAVLLEPTPIQFRAVATKAYTGSPSQTTTVPIPGTVQAGDLLVLALAWYDAFSAPAGWTEQGKTSFVSGTSGSSVAVFTKVAVAGDAGSNVSITGTATANGGSAVLVAYSGVGSVAGASLSAPGSNAPVTAPAQTAAAGEVFVYGFGQSSSAAGTGTEFTFSAATGQTVRGLVDWTPENAQWFYVGLADEPVMATGSTGTRTMSGTSGASGAVGWSLRLSPQASSAITTVSAADAATSAGSVSTAAALSSADAATAASSGTAAPPAAPSVYQSTVVADAPSIYWRLGESAGATTVADSSGNARSGTVTGTPTFGASGLLTGDTNTAVTFSGSQRITAPDTTDLTSVTIEAWVKPTNLNGAGTQFIAGRESSSSTRVCTLYTSLGNPSFQVRTTSGQNAIVNAPALTDGVTYHLVAVYNAVLGQLRLYINGLEVGTATAKPSFGENTALNTADTAFTVGANGVGSNPFYGTIDEVAYYTTALPGERVSAHYAAGTGTAQTVTSTAYRDLVASDSPSLYWRLNETSGTVVTDRAGNGSGYQGTYGGGVTLGVPGAIVNSTDTGVRLDGVDDYVTVAANTGYVLSGYPNFTVEFWVKLGMPTQAGRLFDSTYFRVDVDASGKLSAGFQYYDPPMAFVYTDKLIADNQWHHVVLTGGYQVASTVFVDTVAYTDPTQTPTGWGKVWMGSTTLGSRYQNSATPQFDMFVAASFDEFAIYMNAFNRETVRKHYYTGRDERIPGDDFATAVDRASVLTPPTTGGTLDLSKSVILDGSASYSATTGLTPKFGYDAVVGLPDLVLDPTLDYFFEVDVTKSTTSESCFNVYSLTPDYTRFYNAYLGGTCGITGAGTWRFTIGPSVDLDWHIVGEQTEPRVALVWHDGMQVVAVRYTTKTPPASPSAMTNVNLAACELVYGGTYSAGNGITDGDYAVAGLTLEADKDYELQIDVAEIVGSYVYVRAWSMFAPPNHGNSYFYTILSGGTYPMTPTVGTLTYRFGKSFTPQWSDLIAAGENTLELATNDMRVTALRWGVYGGTSPTPDPSGPHGMGIRFVTEVETPGGSPGSSTLSDTDFGFDDYPQTGYRYFTFDILTDQLLAEIPLSDVNFSVKLANVGELTATLPIGQLDYDIDAYSATMPMRTALYVLRDKTAVWGGIIWARDYDATTRTLQLSCATWESYLFRRYIWHTLETRDDANQYDVVRQMMQQLRHDFEFTYDAYDYVIPAPQSSAVDIYVDVTAETTQTQDKQVWKREDMKSFGEALTEFANNLNGFEWFFQINFNEKALRFRRYLRLLPTPPVLLPKGADNPPYDEAHRPGIDTYLFEFPGNIASITVTEDGDNSATRQFVVGGFSTLASDSKPIGSWNNTEYLNDGYPLVENIESSKHSTVSRIPKLMKLATVYGRDAAPTIRTWNIVVNGSMDPIVGSYRVGHWCRLVVNDPFLQRSLESTSEYDPENGVVKRIVGYSVAVPNSPQTAELVTLELEDDPTVGFDLTQEQAQGSLLNDRGPFYYGTYMPDATSTGVVDVDKLTRYNPVSDDTITLKPGTVIEDKTIYGDVFVSSGNTGPVILRRCRLVGGSNVPGSARGVVNVSSTPGKVALKMVDCEIIPRTRSRRRDGIVGRGFELTRTSIEGVVQAFIFDPGARSNTNMAITVLGCWVKSLLRVDGRKARAVSHLGGVNVLVKGNRFTGKALTNSDNAGDFTGSTSDYLVAGNYSDAVIYMDDASGVAGFDTTVVYQQNYVERGAVQTRIMASVDEVTYTGNFHFWDVAKNEAAGYPGTYISIQSRATTVVGLETSTWKDGPYAGSPLIEPRAMGIEYEGA